MTARETRAVRLIGYSWAAFIVGLLAFVGFGPLVLPAQVCVWIGLAACGAFLALNVWIGWRLDGNR